MAKKGWIKDLANGDYIRMDAGDREIIDSVQEIDLSPYVETTYVPGRVLRASEIPSDEGRSRQPQQVRMVVARSLPDHGNHTSAHRLWI